MKIIEREHRLTPSSSFPKDSIDLIELWRILVRRKILMLLTFIATLLLAAAYLFLAKPLYESKVVVQVGLIGKEVQYIEDVNGIKQRLLAEHPELTSVTVDTSKRGAINIFTLTLQNKDRIQAEHQLIEITEKLLNDHNVLFAKTIDPIRQQIDLLQRRSLEYKDQIETFDTLIERLKIKDPAQAAILLIEKEQILRAINALEERIAALQRSIIEPYFLPTRLLGTQITPKTPVEPKAVLVIALSIILGLILSIFTAFFAEFLAHARENETA